MPTQNPTVADLAPHTHLARRKPSRGHLDDVVAAIKHEGYDFGEKSSGRVVHFALIGMTKHGIVRQLGDGYWSKATANEEVAGLA